MYVPTNALMFLYTDFLPAAAPLISTSKGFHYRFRTSNLIGDRCSQLLSLRAALATVPDPTLSASEGPVSI